MIQELVILIGKSRKLYGALLHYLRTLFIKSGDYKFEIN